MRKVFMASVAAISLTMMPALATAQANPGSAASASAMTAQQKSAYDSWTPDRKADFDTWTAAQKSYFWSLDTQKQTGYWALTPEQRAQIQGLTPEQQNDAWASIAAQLSGQAATPVPPAPAAPPPPAEAPPMNPDEETGAVPPAAAAPIPTPASAPAPAGGANTQFVSNTTVQGGMTAPTAQADYPVCKGEVKDGCVNRGGK